MTKLLIIFSVIFAIFMIKITLSAKDTANHIKTQQINQMEKALKDAGV